MWRLGDGAVGVLCLRVAACVVVALVLLSPPAAFAGTTPIPPPTLSFTDLPTPAHRTRDADYSWNTGSGVPGQVYLQLIAGQSEPYSTHPATDTPMPVAYGNSGKSTETLTYDRYYRFELYTIGLHHRLLETVTIGHGQARTQIVARSWRPPRTGPAINRLVQIAPIAMFLLILSCVVAYLRSLRVAVR